MDLFACNGINEHTIYNTTHNINVKAMYQKAKNSLKTSLFELVSKQKQLYLASFGLSTEFNLLDNINLQQLIKNLGINAKKIITCHRPVIAQSANILLTYVQQNQDLFAEAVSRFMTIDPTYHCKFAFSCFPSIYGYFSTKQMASNACSFICSVIDTCQPFFINSLISSFFLSVHRFIDTFSYILNQKISLDLSDIDIFLCCAQCLTQTAPLFTPEHSMVLKYYLNRKHDDAVKYILQTLIPRLITHCKNNISHRCNKNKIDKLCSFIKQLQIDDQGAELIINILLNVDGKYVLPDLPPFTCISRIPYAITSDDISLLCEIFGSGTNIDEALICLKNANFKDKFTPLIVEVLTPCPQPKKEHQSAVDPMCLRAFNALYDRANRLNMDVFLLYEKEKEKSEYFRSETFIEYLNQMKRQICIENIDILGEIVDINYFIHLYQEYINDSLQTYQNLASDIYNHLIQANQQFEPIKGANLVYGASLLDQTLLHMPVMNISDISFDMRLIPIKNETLKKWLSSEQYIDLERNSSILLHIMHVARSIIYAMEHGYKSLSFPQVFGNFLKLILSPKISWTLELTKQYLGFRFELREIWGKENEKPFVYVLSCSQNIESEEIVTLVNQAIRPKNHNAKEEKQKLV